MSECFCRKLKVQGREASGFTDAKQYIELLEELKKRAFTVLPPTKFYSRFTKEDWYQCPNCQQVWRLVHPDPPFEGVWEMVE
jgi:hypothetical protein